MPEMTFVIRWPDGSVEACYSPSLVIRDHLTVGCEYALAEFLERTISALDVASERVREKYGSPCSLALAQSARIAARARSFAGVPNASVRVEGFA